MGRNEKGIIRGFQHDLKQIPCVEAQDRSSVGANVSDAFQTGIKPLYAVPIGKKNKVVIFSGRTLFFIDITYFTTQHKPNRRPTARWYRFVATTGNIRSQAVQSRFRRYQHLGNLGKPFRMGKITGPHHRNSL